MSEIKNQIVYVLSNESMPGLIKIGKTTQSEVDERIKQLYTTGVPLPFKCEFACQVRDASEVEKALHNAFQDARINLNREFFKLEPDRVISILKLLKVDEITATVEKKIQDTTPEVDKQANRLYKGRRPVLNFEEIGIPQGAILHFAKDESIEVTVASAKKVSYQNDEYFLTPITRRFLGLAPDAPIQPSPYWKYNGRILRDIYHEVHSLEDGDDVS